MKIFILILMFITTVYSLQLVADKNTKVGNSIFERTPSKLPCVLIGVIDAVLVISLTFLYTRI